MSEFVPKKTTAHACYRALSGADKPEIVRLRAEWQATCDVLGEDYASEWDVGKNRRPLDSLVSEALSQKDSENARLQAIVDALPKCWRLKDGELVQDVPVVPGMRLWWPSLGGIRSMEVVSLGDLSSDWPATVRMAATSEPSASLYRWHVQGCYNTREAAEHAAEAAGGMNENVR